MPTSMPLITLELPFLLNLNFVLTYFLTKKGLIFFSLCFIIINNVISRDLFHSVYLYLSVYFLFFLNRCTEHLSGQ